jgi:hypothetical protein
VILEFFRSKRLRNVWKVAFFIIALMCLFPPWCGVGTYERWFRAYGPVFWPPDADWGWDGIAPYAFTRYAIDWSILAVQILGVVAIAVAMSLSGGQQNEQPQHKGKSTVPRKE